MDNDTILMGFMEGFAKVAEDAGFTGEATLDLLKLAVDLAQGVAHKEAFDLGFSEAHGRM